MEIFATVPEKRAAELCAIAWAQDFTRVLDRSVSEMRAEEELRPPRVKWKKNVSVL